jgi:hypothetical protein
MAEGPKRIVPFGRFDPRDPLGMGIGDKDFSFTPKPVEEGKGTVMVEVPIPSMDPEGFATIPAPHPSEVRAVLGDPGLSGKDIPSATTGSGEPDPPIGTGTDKVATGNPIPDVPPVKLPPMSEVPEGTGSDRPPATVPPLVAKSSKSQKKALDEDTTDS